MEIQRVSEEAALAIERYQKLVEERGESTVNSQSRKRGIARLLQILIIQINTLQDEVFLFKV